jgi:serine/threonine protein kinase
MRKDEVINGYTILEEPIVAGGMSMISFASKHGEHYFIKEFLRPKYPLPGSPGSEKVKEKKRKECEEFEKHHRKLIEEIDKRVSRGGNIVKTLDFFRWGSCYYKITDKIDVTSLSCEEISNLTKEQKRILINAVCHSIRTLHDLQIVHGDLKPDNILIKKKTEKDYTAKVIDFDDYYFSGKPPKEREKIVGTPEYYSPEQECYIMDEEMKIDGKTLTCKSDVFSLGIIFCEYFTGKKPLFKDFDGNTCDAIREEKVIKFAKAIPRSVKEIIRQMLRLKANERPDIKDVFERFKKFDPKEPDEPDENESKLKISDDLKK